MSYRYHIEARGTDISLQRLCDIFNRQDWESGYSVLGTENCLITECRDGKAVILGHCHHHGCLPIDMMDDTADDAGYIYTAPVGSKEARQYAVDVRWEDGDETFCIKKIVTLQELCRELKVSLEIDSLINDHITDPDRRENVVNGMHININDSGEVDMRWTTGSVNLAKLKF